MKVQIKPSSKKIFNYWKTLCISEPDKVLYQLFDDTRYENIIEGNEKTCFCCGYEGYVERAHIVPLALGGTNSLDNLLLLCTKCHADSPDVMDSNYMFAWINKQPDYFSKELAMQMGHIFPDDLATINRLLCCFNNRDAAEKLIQLGLSLGLDANSIKNDVINAFKIKIRQANTHGFIFSESTKAAVLNQALFSVMEKYTSL